VARISGAKSVADTAMMDVVLLLVSGASGSGKSSVRQAIATAIEPEVVCVELRHLGTIPKVPTLAWRQQMAERAVRLAQDLDCAGRDLLVAGDPVAPGEALAAPSAQAVDIAICLLDIDEESQLERLRHRGDPEELLGHHVAFADWLRRHSRDPRHMPHVLRSGGWPEMRWSRVTDVSSEDWRITIIDVSPMTREEANQAVLQWVTDARAGAAPVFRRTWTS
jgi:predicted ABC-type ATPase